jgi:hypothetical protein
MYTELSKKKEKTLAPHKAGVTYEGPNKVLFYARNMQIIIIYD